MNFLNIPVRIAIIRAKLMRRDGGLPGIQSSYSTGASPDVDPRNPPFVDAVAAKAVEGDGAASLQEHSSRTQPPLVKDEVTTGPTSPPLCFEYVCMKSSMSGALLHQ